MYNLTFKWRLSKHVTSEEHHLIVCCCTLSIGHIVDLVHWRPLTREQSFNKYVPLTMSTSLYGNSCLQVSPITPGVCNRWTGPLDWTTGLDYWTHLWPQKMHSTQTAKVWEIVRFCPCDLWNALSAVCMYPRQTLEWDRLFNNRHTHTDSKLRKYEVWGR